MTGVKSNDELWRRILTQYVPEVHAERFIWRRLPSDPRCEWCKMPFAGAGGRFMQRVFRRYPSNLNPRVCNVCDDFMRTHPGGAEVELTLLFADVRGSTRIAERMSPMEFSRLMDRFYSAATTAVCQTEGLIEKFVGDEVACLYVPGFAGENHAQKALEAARSLLLATGHADVTGPWLPVGAGIHTGVAYVGSVGSAGVSQLTVLGDLPNATARLAASAAAGEILVSESAYAAANLHDEVERRELELKGREQKLAVRVLRVAASDTNIVDSA